MNFFAVLIAVFSLCYANAFVTPPSLAYTEVVLPSSCISMTQNQPSLGGRFASSAPIPPPPPLSIPVWSLSCPIPVTRFSQSSSMSILTFVTPGKVVCIDIMKKKRCFLNLNFFINSPHISCIHISYNLIPLL